MVEYLADAKFLTAFLTNPMTTLDPDTVRALARELDDAERTRRQVEHFSLRHPGMTIADSYAVQRAWVDIKCAAGRSIRGHKIGLTSRAMQLASQITEPDFGALLDDMFFAAGAEIPAARFIVPRAEVELAFVLGGALAGEGLTVDDVLAATDYVVPAIEIIDARIEQFDRKTKAPRKVIDTIADNAANAGVILGDRHVKPRSVDLRWCGALLHKNDIVEETGLAAGVLNHPANGVVWLVNKLAPHGEGLKAGEVVLAGSFTRPVACAPGDRFVADYGPLGTIPFRFA